MKFLKYALAIFAVAIVTDAIVAKAYAAPSQVGIIRELVRNNSTFSDYKTKNTWTTQTYFNSKSYTWLTNPCPSCKVAVRPYTEDGDYGTTRITTTGQTVSLNSPTSFGSPNNYRLLIWRSDATAIDTHHEGVWKINLLKNNY